MRMAISQTDLTSLGHKICERSEELLDDLGIEHYYQGDAVFMPCPIHFSDDTRSCSISLSKGVWRCWTRSCHEEYKGILGFVRGVLSINEGMPVSFPKTVNYLKELYGYEMGSVDYEETPFVMPPREWKRFHIDVPTIGSSPYYIDRGYKADTIKTFQVNDCKAHGHPMYFRTIVPIHCENGSTVGYTARGNKGYMFPKFVNSKGLRKSLFLYNLHRAKKHIVNKTMVIVEGCGDVWRMHEAGARNTVAIMGKDISYYQIQLLKEHGIERVVVLTDNDRAGRDSKRAIQRKLHDDFTLIFPHMKKKDVGSLPIDAVKYDILTQIKGMYS